MNTFSYFLPPGFTAPLRVLNLKGRFYRAGCFYAVILCIFFDE